MRVRPQQTGLTLVELIVAMTITVMVAGATAGILRGVNAARQRISQQMALQQEGRAALHAITAALRNAYRSPQSDDTPLEGLPGPDPQTPSDSIRFFTASLSPIRPGQPESEVRECQFLLADSDNGGPLRVLLRRLDPTRNDPPDGGGVVDRIAENIVALQFSYFDGSQWQDRWLASRTDWPAAIRVQLIIASTDEPRLVWPADGVVNFPYRPAGQQGQAQPAEQPKEQSPGQPGNGPPPPSAGLGNQTVQLAQGQP